MTVTSDGFVGKAIWSSMDKISDLKKSAALNRSAAGEESAETLGVAADVELEIPATQASAISNSLATRSMAERAIAHFSINGPTGA